MYVINNRAKYRKILESFKVQQEKGNGVVIKDSQFNKGYIYGLYVALDILKDWEISQPNTESGTDPDQKESSTMNSDSGVSPAPIVRRKRLETWQDLFIFDLTDEEFDEHFQADTHHEKCLKSWLRCLCRWIKNHDIRKI